MGDEALAHHPGEDRMRILFVATEASGEFLGAQLPPRIDVHQYAFHRALGKRGIGRSLQDIVAAWLRGSTRAPGPRRRCANDDCRG